MLVGTARLFGWVDRNPAVRLTGTRYTHDADVLASSYRLAAINSAIEVDLTGQVNAEAIGGRYVGAVGGAGDFLRGAAWSPGGVPIVALPSVARDSSRIVARLWSGFTPRSEQLVVVTEYGVADLRGLTLPERVEAMIAIAHPDHRRALTTQQHRSWNQCEKHQHDKKHQHEEKRETCRDCRPLRTAVGSSVAPAPGVGRRPGCDRARRGGRPYRYRPRPHRGRVLRPVLRELREAPCIGRWAALHAGLPIEVPGPQIDRRCGGGLQAVITAAMTVQTGRPTWSWPAASNR